MTDTTTHTTTDDDSGSIDVGELTCMRGHAEARDELLSLPQWDHRRVSDLEASAHGYEDFARCVVDERRRAE